VLGRFENIIDFSHISLRPLSVPHLDTELRGVKILYQFQIVMEGWHLLVNLLGKQSSGRPAIISAVETFLPKL